jgi:tetratricopeptide (TPR) repeat protein
MNMSVQYRSYLMMSLTLLILFSCKEKGILPVPVAPERDWKSELNEYESLLKKNPDFNNFQIGVLKISQMLVDTFFVNQRKDILLRGIQWCREFNNDNYALVFKKEYVKSYPKDENSREYLIDIAKSLDEDTRELEIKMLYDGILKRWPTSKTSKENWDRIKRDPSEFDFFLKSTGEKMFGTPKKFEIDSVRVQQFISLSEAYAYAYPEDARSPAILMNAATAGQTGKMAAKSVELFDWVWRSYPEFPEAPLTLFLKGFIYENDIQNKDQAIETYNLFLKKYPDHPRAREAKFLLENIHTSNEGLIKKLEN